MALDPSIPLGFNPQPTGPNIGQVAQQANMLLQLQQQKRQMQAQNALAQLFQRQGATGPDGNLTSDAMRQVMAIDPATGMRLRDQQAKAENLRATTALHTTEAAAKKQELAQGVRGGAVEAYDQALAAGMSEPQARAAAQGVYTSGLDELKKSGAFSAEEQQGLIPEFDPVRARANALKYKDWVAERERMRHDRTTEGIAGGHLAVAQRGEAFREVEDKIRTGLERERLDYAEGKISGGDEAKLDAKTLDLMSDQALAVRLPRARSPDLMPPNSAFTAAMSAPLIPRSAAFFAIASRSATRFEAPCLPRPTF